MKSKKLNVMKTRPDISDAEIQSMMDFDKVLQLHKTARRSRSIMMIIGSGVIIALIVGWAILNRDEKETTTNDTNVIVPDKKEPITEPQSEQEPVQKEEKKVVTKPVEVPKKLEQRETAPVPATPADVYVEAEPVNGYEDLYAYFEKELKYPSDVANAVEGDVAVTFVLNRNGKPEQIKFINSLGPEFDTEVIRVINNMPEWKPATQNGKPVPAKISQSFTFSIKK